MSSAHSSALFRRHNKSAWNDSGAAESLCGPSVGLRQGGARSTAGHGSLTHGWWIEDCGIF